MNEAWKRPATAAEIAEATNDVLQFRKGRPKVSDDVNRAKSAERQRNYRARIRKKLERLNALESGLRMDAGQ